MYSDAKRINQSIHEVFELLSCVYQRLRLLQKCKCFFFQYGAMSKQVDERIIKKIHQYVGEGIRSFEEMERVIRFVCKE